MRSLRSTVRHTRSRQYFYKPPMYSKWSAQPDESINRSSPAYDVELASSPKLKVKHLKVEFVGRFSYSYPTSDGKTAQCVME